MESPRVHASTPHRESVRYVVVIDSGGSMIARLFLATREMVSEIDAAVEEVSAMITGRAAVVGALGFEWDAALAGHSVVERAAAKVYAIDI